MNSSSVKNVPSNQYLAHNLWPAASLCDEKYSDVVTKSFSSRALIFPGPTKGSYDARKPSSPLVRGYPSLFPNPLTLTVSRISASAIVGPWLRPCSVPRSWTRPCCWWWCCSGRVHGGDGVEVDWGNVSGKQHADVVLRPDAGRMSPALRQALSALRVDQRQRRRRNGGRAFERMVDVPAERRRAKRRAGGWTDGGCASWTSTSETVRRCRRLTAGSSTTSTWPDATDCTP